MVESQNTNGLNKIKFYTFHVKSRGAQCRVDMAALIHSDPGFARSPGYFHRVCLYLRGTAITAVSQAVGRRKRQAAAGVPELIHKED